MEKIQLNSLSDQEFKAFCAKQFNISFHDLSSELIETIISIANSYEPNSIIIDDPNHFRQYTGDWEDDHHHNDWLLDIASKKINIDIKASTLNSIAVAMDVLFTSGFTSATLRSIGWLKQSIFLLDEKEGEVCHLDILKEANTLSSKELALKIQYQKCLYPHHECMHMREKGCTITDKNIEKNLVSLENKQVVKQKDGKWTIF